MDEEELDLVHQAEPSPAEPPPARLVEPTIQIPVIHLQIFPISAGSHPYVRIHLLASSTRDALLLARSTIERTTSTLDLSQVRIPNPKSLIQFHRIESIPDAQELEYLSDIRRTIFFRFV